MTKKERAAIHKRRMENPLGEPDAQAVICSTVKRITGEDLPFDKALIVFKLLMEGRGP
jgi:hypothetical protein